MRQQYKLGNALRQRYVCTNCLLSSFYKGVEVKNMLKFEVKVNPLAECHLRRYRQEHPIGTRQHGRPISRRTT